MPMVEIKLKSQTEAAIEVDGKSVGTVTVALREQQSIEGRKNPIVVLGKVVNAQDGYPYGFTLSVVPDVIKASAPPTPKPSQPQSKGAA